jgi:hypothetical protein
MKFSVSRRTRTFVAKWGGLVLAAILVIPISILGGMFLHASTRVDDTLSWVTEAISLGNILSPGPSTGSTPGVVYRIPIIIINGTPDPAEVTVLDARIKLDELEFDIVGSAGWHGDIPGNGSLTFEGDIVLKPEDSKQLDGKTVNVMISGSVRARASYKFVEKERTIPVEISTIGIIPMPIVTSQ